MYVLSLFDHSLRLELAISELEEHNISSDSILATPINKSSLEKTYMDPFNADGLNVFIVSVLGMIFMLLGSIYGFVLYWGPIIWGLIGLGVGCLIGFIIDFLYKKKIRKHTLKKHIMDVILIVKCDENTVEMVEKILTDHHTLGLSRVL